MLRHTCSTYALFLNIALVAFPAARATTLLIMPHRCNPENMINRFFFTAYLLQRGKEDGKKPS
jgi:hypothetical protein